MKHLQYASYVVRHKSFVFRAGLETGAPLWRLIIHDWSKFSPAEWFPYVEMFYGDGDNQEAFDRAWLHHQHRNAHHWQHWILRLDTGGVTSLEMPEEYVREMVADWMGAGRAITGKWDVKSWYAQNRDRIVLHENTQVLVDELVEVHG